VLDTATGQLEYANAGHNLPLLYHARTGQVEVLPKGDMALGVLEGLAITSHQLTIDKGDTLVLFTDGITDLQSPDGGYFGEERLQAILRSHGRETVHNLLEQIDDALIEFRRGLPSADDITLVAVRREPTSRRRKNRQGSAAPADDSQ
jgi:sigma-B regulation protein RsbU (phosphoserine phosphatase)